MVAFIDVAVVGSGYFSQFHCDAWNRIDGIRLRALCTLDQARGIELGERYGVPGVYSSLPRMLDEVRPDLLDIVTPPDTHFALIREAAERGIPVICQKPLAPTLIEAEEIVRTAERAGILFVVHENFRFMPWFRHAREMIDEGTLGRLHAIQFRLRPGDGQGPRAYLNRQPYFQKMERFLVHETGIHFIDSFRYLMGEVSSVFAQLRQINPAIAGEDAGYVVFTFAEGATGLFDGNRLNDHLAEDCRLTMGEMHLEGSDGVLRLDGYGRLWWKPHGRDEVEEAYDWDRRGFGGDCVYHLQKHVIDHLREGTPLVNTGRDYLVNLRVEEAIYKSNRRGRRSDLAP